MDPLLEQDPEQRVEGVVGLGEVDPGAVLGDGLEAGEALGLGQQGASDGGVLPRLLRLDLGQPLPGLALPPVRRYLGTRNQQ